MMRTRTPPNKVDMVAGNPWGNLEAVRSGATWPYWWFRCLAHGHEFTRSAQDVRNNHKAGKANTCPECKRLEKEAKSAERVAAE